MQFYYKYDGNLITTYDFGKQAVEDPIVISFIAYHDSKYPVQVTGMYIPPSDDYTGSVNARYDYQEILRWGDRWGKGLTLYQPGTSVLLKSKVGTKDYPVPLLQNEGIIAPRGKRADVKASTIGSHVLEWPVGSLGGHSIGLYEALQGYSASLNTASQQGILCSGSDVADADKVTIGVKDQYYNDIYGLDDTQVIGKLWVTGLTQAQLDADSYYIDGIGYVYTVDFFTKGGLSHVMAAPFNLVYSTRDINSYFDEVALSLRLQIPRFVPKPYTYQFGFDIAFHEIR